MKYPANGGFSENLAVVVVSLVLRSVNASGSDNHCERRRNAGIPV